MCGVQADDREGADVEGSESISGEGNVGEGVGFSVKVQ